MNERELLSNFKSAADKVNAISQTLKDAKKELDAAEAKLIDHLEGAGATATGKYDGLGYAQLSKPRVFASCRKENEEQLKAYLKLKGREDLIREAIHPSSLSGFVGELIEAGKPVPDFIGYYLQQNVRIY